MADAATVQSIEDALNALEARLPGLLPALLNNALADALERKGINAALDTLGTQLGAVGQKLDGVLGAIHAWVDTLPPEVRALLDPVLSKAQAAVHPATAIPSSPAEQAAPVLPVLHLTAAQVRKLAALDKAALAALIGA